MTNKKRLKRVIGWIQSFSFFDFDADVPKRVPKRPEKKNNPVEPEKED